MQILTRMPWAAVVCTLFLRFCGVYSFLEVKSKSLQEALLSKPMTAWSKQRGQKKEAASSFCPFAPVESFMVAKVASGSVGVADIDLVVTWPLLAQGRIWTRVSPDTATNNEKPLVIKILHLEKRHPAKSRLIYIPGYPGITRPVTYPGIFRDK